MKTDPTGHPISRRRFIELTALSGAAAAYGVRGDDTAPPTDADGNVIPGFEEHQAGPGAKGRWQPVSDRKLRVGIAGHGLCRFGAAFGFQDHPSVEVVAVTDLIADRRAAMARACRCDKTYQSCEAMLDDDSIEAVYIATDAPSHARLAIMALQRGKHVACAVPAVWGSLEDADALFNAVKKTGLTYMMFETSYYHASLYAAHQRYDAGELGKIVYAEGEYFHHFPTPLPGYNPKTNKVEPGGWRLGLPPMWYPTHATAYYTGVTGERFTEVSCMGMPSPIGYLQPENNPYRNPFGTEVALLRTSEAGMSRMAMSWDVPTGQGEKGRVYGQSDKRGNTPTQRPPLPPGVKAGGHGGSHGYLMSEFVEAVLAERRPWVDITAALNMTVAGIVAHQSALKDGELLKIPQYTL
ncbi:MAG: Gfo/Idh/MocA family protein [Phycisphaeraceae bacterium]